MKNPHEKIPLPRSGEKYDRIRGAAVKVVADKGFHKTRITDIAARAGVEESAHYSPLNYRLIRPDTSDRVAALRLFGARDESICSWLFTGKTIDPEQTATEVLEILRKGIRTHPCLN